MARLEPRWPAEDLRRALSRGVDSLATERRGKAKDGREHAPGREARPIEHGPIEHDRIEDGGIERRRREEHLFDPGQPATDLGADPRTASLGRAR